MRAYRPSETTVIDLKEDGPVLVEPGSIEDPESKFGANPGGATKETGGE